MRKPTAIGRPKKSGKLASDKAYNAKRTVLAPVVTSTDPDEINEILAAKERLVKRYGSTRAVIIAGIRLLDSSD